MFCLWMLIHFDSISKVFFVDSIAMGPTVFVQESIEASLGMAMIYPLAETCQERAFLDRINCEAVPNTRFNLLTMQRYQYCQYLSNTC